MPSEYVTVFQVSSQPVDWQFALAGIIPLVIGILLSFGKVRWKWKSPVWFLPIFSICFGLLWICTAGVSVFRESYKAAAAYKNGNYETVEGVVTDFDPMPYEGHRDECFSVQDQRFCYSDYVIAAGFHTSASHGGPIRSGLPVRIAYSGSTILRLEIPKNEVLSAVQSAAILKSSEATWRQAMDNNPVEHRLSAAFMFTGLCWTLWLNLQWKRVMRIWVRPPNRLWVQYLFRAYFALCLVGAFFTFVRQMYVHPLLKQDVVPTIEIAAIMCSVVALMSASTLWMAHRRDRKANEKLLTAR